PAPPTATFCMREETLRRHLRVPTADDRCTPEPCLQSGWVVSNVVTTDPLRPVADQSPRGVRLADVGRRWTDTVATPALGAWRAPVDRTMQAWGPDTDTTYSSPCRRRSNSPVGSDTTSLSWQGATAQSDLMV